LSYVVHLKGFSCKQCTYKKNYKPKLNGEPTKLEWQNVEDKDVSNKIDNLGKINNPTNFWKPGLNELNTMGSCNYSSSKLRLIGKWKWPCHNGGVLIHS
jgi:hypothetical protein